MYAATKQSSGNGVAYIGEPLLFHTVSAFHTQHITYLKLSPHTLAVRILTHKIKKILVIGIGLYLCNLVVDAIQWIYVLLDGVPGGAPHLVDDADDHDEDHGHEQEEDTRQDGKPDIHIEQGVVLLS